MRLWHYKLIPFLPDSQLRAQWRELNAIFINQPRHILINYIYEYPNLANLETYASIVLNELELRGHRISRKSYENFKSYIGTVPTHLSDTENGLIEMIRRGEPCVPFPSHQDLRYMNQCFFNLQEKYDRGQFDFTASAYEKLRAFVKEENDKYNSLYGTDIFD